MEKKLKRLLFSEILVDSTPTQKVAYISIMTALCVIANMFFEFKFADTQFSLTIFFSAFTGFIIGPLFGAVAAFLGDLVGFLYNSGGFAYYPWIGIAMASVALISGLIMNGVDIKRKGALYVKIAITAALTFFVSTIGINTTAFWISFYSNIPYFEYTLTRLFINGQIYNSIVNYLVLFIAFPTLIELKKIIIKNKN